MAAPGLSKQIAFYYSVITRREVSKALMGNAHLLDVASDVLSRPPTERFYARLLASSTGLPDPVVHPCLRRLEVAGVIRAVHSPGRERLYARTRHPFWDFIRQLDRKYPG